MVRERRQYGNWAPGRGFTLIECLVGLAIMAVLLAAVAVAFNASLTNYRENEDMFWAVNNARQALTRMTSQIRTAYPVQLGDPNNQCSLVTATNEDITYEFRSADNSLYLINNGTNQEYVLCDGVIAANFTKIPNSEGWDCRSVQISLTVHSDDYQKTLAAAAMVRRCPP